jgi:DNA repair ATPase RecN
MDFKLIVAILAIGVMPVCARAQAPSPPKPSKPAKAAPAAPVTTPAAAQKVVKTISGDKAKTQTYCDIGKLGNQIEDAEQKQDMNQIDELNKKMSEMATKLGPEYVALMTRLEDIDPNSKEAREVSSALETLDKLCAK